ncbi:NlpC/P60 family protein [Roseobacter sp. OBYS 0001]|uniref:C40 family peptidase n=1 Tax=Roseobacter sp. OBYS 0001 TaxID=882651 RepID=UPI001BC23CBD|nr:NlpC/P60 family protein [Roseobacter sp. OBYS 0001]GIT86413.1 hypothetical protein ROBYS_14290 [Roseobacter sp. OBYS 0001]
MTDRRVTPDPAHVTLDIPAQITVPVADLRQSPAGPRDRQVLFGERMTILGRMENHSLIRAQKDGYCGWVSDIALGSVHPVTHRVTSRATHVYAEANFKSPDLMHVGFGAGLNVVAETATFVETPQGFVPRQHVRPAEARATDPATIAELFLGVPYLWGGNAHLGIDCSGLVQAACLACGIACPGDSDQQEKQLGVTLPPGSALQRNDVIFWKGHVALVLDKDTLIHANAGHMLVTTEPITDALARIEMQGDGVPTEFKRLEVPT